MSGFCIHLNLDRDQYVRRKEQLRDAALAAIGQIDQLGPKKSLQNLLNVIGYSLSPIYDDSFYIQMLDYTLGMLYAALGDVPTSISRIDKANVLPANSSNLIFTDHTQSSLKLWELREAARDRGIPAIYLVSMPRSASASITLTISDVLDAPLMRLSLGDYPNCFLVPSWVAIFNRGGALLHDHFGATEHNINVLRNNEVHEIFVIYRDPRAAALSLAEMQNDIFTREEFEDLLVQILASDYVSWLTGWSEVEARESAWLRVHWLESSLVRFEPLNALKLIIDSLQISKSSFRQAKLRDVALMQANVRFGEDERWRRIVSDATQKIMWEHVAPLAQKFGLRP